MGFLGSLAKATTAQNESNISVDPSQQSNQYLPGANSALSNALGAGKMFDSNMAAEQQLANMYTQMSQGQGPNPAQQMLSNQTGQNVAQQAALMGSQRGASSNAGMIARQAGQQGGAIQQNATGQAALLQAQQQMAAQQALGGLYGQMGNQNLQFQANNSNLFGTAAGANYNQVQQHLAAQQMQSQINQNNADTANNALKGLASGSGAAASMAGGIQGGNSQQGGGGGGSVGGGGGGAGAMAGMMFGMAQGGQVPQQAPMPQMMPTQAMPSMGPQSFAGKFLSGMAPMPSGQQFSTGMADSAPALTQHIARLSAGSYVPGRANVGGDSKQNDTVPAMLSPGEIVIPRSMANDPDKAAAFARQIVMKHRGARK